MEIAVAGRPQKFPALRKYLENKANEYRHSGETEPLAMTFSEIEALGDLLPPSARKHRAWWANGSAKKPWARARFHAEDVDMERQPLPFRYKGVLWPKGRARREEKIKGSQAVSRQKLSDFKLRIALKSSPKPALAGMADGARVYSGVEKITAGTPPRCRHPLYGALKGHIKLVAGTDLTEPADPEWGERVWGDDTK